VKVYFVQTQPQPGHLSSCQPISNLSFLSKVVEISHWVLSLVYVWYRADQSTKTAIIAAYDKIVRCVDSGDRCVLVLRDISAAFDTIDHSTLLHVRSQRRDIWLEHYIA